MRLYTWHSDPLHELPCLQTRTQTRIISLVSLGVKMPVEWFILNLVLINFAEACGLLELVEWKESWVWLVAPRLREFTMTALRDSGLWPQPLELQ